MAERKSGPVKPPVIDLTAKPARPRAAATKPIEPSAEPKPEATPAEAVAAPAAKASTAPPDPKPAESPAVATDPGADSTTEAPRPTPPRRPPARLAMPWSAISIAALAGALLGTALTYAAVTFIPLPDTRPIVADPGPRLAAQDAAIAELTTRLAAAEAANTATGESAGLATAAASAELAALRQQVETMPAPSAVDLAPLEAQVASLEDSIAAINAGASGGDATALADTIAGLESGLGELRATLDALTQRTTTAEASVATLSGELDAVRSTVAAQAGMVGSSDIGPAVRLPLMVSGIESAFANGRPYADELSGVTTLLPGLDVPAPITAAAADGMQRPDAVAAEFIEAVPTILAGRPADGSGDLTQDALDWAKGILALRPADETEGETPEAVVSRLEAAVGRRDFVAAAALLDQLPESMQVAAGPVATDIRALAAADGFIATLRASALQQPEPAPEPAPESETPEAETPAADAPAADAPAAEEPAEASQ